jgi:ABC-2 type transport system permease protein
MIGALIKAEFRKIFTVNLWWALLIPVVVLSFGAGWLGTSIGTVSQMQAELGKPLPVGLLTVSMSTNFSTIFAALFGAMAVSGEHRSKSITTTYLTGNPRGAVLSAKLVTYASLGVLYGLVNILFASVGALIGASFQGFGDAGDWFAVGGAGLLAMVLWTLLGVGVGALISNSVVSIIALLVYRFVFESVVSIFLIGSASAVGAYLPNGAGSGIVGNLAVPIFISAVLGRPETTVPENGVEVLHFFFGGTYGHAWWLSLITFVGYTAVFVLGGWLVSRRRDIT